MVSWHNNPLPKPWPRDPIPQKYEEIERDALQSTAESVKIQLLPDDITREEYKEPEKVQDIQEVYPQPEYLPLPMERDNVEHERVQERVQEQKPTLPDDFILFEKSSSSPSSLPQVQTTTMRGTWTPTLGCNMETIQTSNKTCKYSLIDGLVTAFFDIKVREEVAQDNLLLGIQIGGLPIESAGTSEDMAGVATVHFFNHVRPHCTSITGTVAGGGKRVVLWRQRDNGSALNHLTRGDITNITLLCGVIQYHCADF